MARAYNRAAREYRKLKHALPDEVSNDLIQSAIKGEDWEVDALYEMCVVCLSTKFLMITNNTPKKLHIYLGVANDPIIDKVGNLSEKQLKVAIMQLVLAKYHRSGGVCQSAKR